VAPSRLALTGDLLARKLFPEDKTMAVAAAAPEEPTPEAAERGAYTVRTRCGAFTQRKPAEQELTPEELTPKDGLAAATYCH